ncbi:hypothetical protein RALTA_A0906 [Cupriavidus taiwanensis LMG 19424]|uniref:Uncharacterized protein n=1 Tax=Cupriavidus taiwanensis (strain DSM 17343 / BCRC 17206 / CCUG 44338 / CIP 107171 / LMG 19424 / R1) TaxID=977880 RepID=B3R3J2_CUPTR|nr:hypothetical protein RALTA_A0906 [Cupriavidus taiwanensis LMG 19424]
MDNWVERHATNSGCLTADRDHARPSVFVLDARKDARCNALPNRNLQLSNIPTPLFDSAQSIAGDCESPTTGSAAVDAATTQAILSVEPASRQHIA